MLSTCVKAVRGLGIVGGFNRNLHTAKTLTNQVLCVTSGFITNSYSTCTTGFTLVFRSISDQLSLVLVNTFHTTNKDNEILYKLITIS